MENENEAQVCWSNMFLLNRKSVLITAWLFKKINTLNTYLNQQYSNIMCSLN